ncbi:MTH1187 family thiamine-binding protein [Natribaculum luteum]|uniref:MTH1187 family thiamine-binding protein n=1 Tax=Natribaculum luteum TaxID=1586232 RepID=A0ABD5P082_9EURY|nr:MTH1187 family thiamine-binding protein [Natribaculum luteum]
MTAIGELNVVPIREGSMSEEIAKAVDALEAFDVAYETNPMGTIVEADDASELFAAAEAAHAAVDEDRVITTLKVDDKRTVDQRASEKVDAVERRLGREARQGE